MNIKKIIVGIIVLLPTFLYVFQIDLFKKSSDILVVIRDFNEVNNETMEVIIDLGGKLNEISKKLITSRSDVSCKYSDKLCS